MQEETRSSASKNGGGTTERSPFMYVHCTALCVCVCSLFALSALRLFLLTLFVATCAFPPPPLGAITSPSPQGRRERRRSRRKRRQLLRRGDDDDKEQKILGPGRRGPCCTSSPPPPRHNFSLPPPPPPFPSSDAKSCPHSPSPPPFSACIDIPETSVPEIAPPRKKEPPPAFNF